MADRPHYENSSLNLVSFLTCDLIFSDTLIVASAQLGALVEKSFLLLRSIITGVMRISAFESIAPESFQTPSSFSSSTRIGWLPSYGVFLEAFAHQGLQDFEDLTCGVGELHLFSENPKFSKLWPKNNLIFLCKVISLTCVLQTTTNDKVSFEQLVVIVGSMLLDRNISSSLLMCSARRALLDLIHLECFSNSSILRHFTNLPCNPVRRTQLLFMICDGTPQTKGISQQFCLDLMKQFQSEITPSWVEKNSSITFQDFVSALCALDNMDSCKNAEKLQLLYCYFSCVICLVESIKAGDTCSSLSVPETCARIETFQAKLIPVDCEQGEVSINVFQSSFEVCL
jgi:hypothetical protein